MSERSERKERKNGRIRFKRITNVILEQKSKNTTNSSNIHVNRNNIHNRICNTSIHIINNTTISNIRKLSRQNKHNNNNRYNTKLVSTYSTLIKSKTVLRQVISNLGINISEDELEKNITVSQEKDTEIIRISVTNADATTAAKVANEVAKVFSQRVSEIYKINNVQVVDQAEVDTIPSNINHTKDVIIFAFVGVVVAVMYVLIANMLDTTIKTAEEVEKEFKVPVLASIPLYNFEPAKKGGKRK